MKTWVVSWASWHNVFFLPLIVFLVLIYAYRQYKVRRVIRIIAGMRYQQSILHYSEIKQWIKLFLISIGMGLLFIALLRPQWSRKEEVVAQEGRDVLIALDISRSMLAQDCEPNRLENAKKKIRYFLSLLSCERVGLLLFSGSAFVQCPLTSDYDAFYMFLDQVDVETISSGTTALDAALAKAIQTFRSLPERKSKLCVVFTDGEDFSSNLSSIKREVMKENVRVFTMGVGTTQGAPIPLYDEKGKPQGFQKDAKGNVVISHLNDGILHALSQDAGGMYIPGTQDAKDVKQLVRCITAYEKDRLEDKRIASLQDKYPYVVAIGLLCFFLEWML